MNTLKAVDERSTQDDLERENARLQKLVAELLARNQQLRQALEYVNHGGAVVGNGR
jgi:hypothetical protein